MPSAVHVANRLSELGIEDLTDLLLARPFQCGRQQDLHDLADTLLSADSITPTLRGLSRESLVDLVSGSADQRCKDLLLADPSGIAYSEVRHLVPALLDKAVPEVPIFAGADSSTLLHTVAAIRDLISWVSTEPLPMSATGGILKAEEKTLALGLVIPEAEVHTIVWLAERAGVVRTVNRTLRATQIGMDLIDDQFGLWKRAVSAVLSELSSSVIDSLTRADRLDTAYLDWVWPLRDSRGNDTLDRVGQSLTMLGLVAGSTTELGVAVLRNDEVSLSNLTSTALPPLSSTVYVLDDLSIIAPGPITTETARFLETLSVLESRGLAAKRRLDPARIVRTIAMGETVESITDQLAAVSLTPLSSAITSTITDIATKTRFVALNGTGTDTVARASHPELGSMLMTDPRLQRLSPVAVDDVTVLYGAARDRVEATLIEGRYTVVTPELPVLLAEEVPASPAISLAHKLHTVGLGSSHLERALVVAGKSRSRVTLVIETGTGERTITLEPRQVTNGRVRGLDTGSDVERTFPISAIVELKAVGE